MRVYIRMRSVKYRKFTKHNTGCMYAIDDYEKLHKRPFTSLLLYSLTFYIKKLTACFDTESRHYFVIEDQFRVSNF